MRAGQWALWGAVLALALPLGIGSGLLLAGNGDAPLARGSARSADSTLGSMPGVDSLARRARAEAPFRPDGRPSGVAYDPLRSESSMVQDGFPRPPLALTGLLGGARPLAVVDGIPGRDGPVVLGVGDTVAGLRVQRIKEGRVTIKGMDTTWVLTVRGAP